VRCTIFKNNIFNTILQYDKLENSLDVVEKYARGEPIHSVNIMLPRRELDTVLEISEEKDYPIHNLVTI